MSDIDPIVKTAVDVWLSKVESFRLRAERVPDGALPWLYEAAMVGVAAMREAESQRAAKAVKDTIIGEEEMRRRRYRELINGIM